jgi:hypothetical protein
MRHAMMLSQFQRNPALPDNLIAPADAFGHTPPSNWSAAIRNGALKLAVVISAENDAFRKQIPLASHLEIRLPCFSHNMPAIWPRIPRLPRSDAAIGDLAGGT